MEQMSTEGLDLITLDLDAPGIPDSVRDFHPTIFKNGNEICCILGPNRREGIFGCGQTVREALDDFDRQFQQRKEQPMDGNPVSDFIQQRHI